jgi:regulator of RNase E activity RraA
MQLPKKNPRIKCMSKQNMNEEDKELVALFKGLDTPGVSDGLDKLGLHGQAMKIMPLANYPQAIVGPAFTVKYVPASNPPGTVGDFIDDVAPGDIVVIDNDGRTDCTVWGDIMTQYAGIRGIAGTVIDGVCRDVSKALIDSYPMFTAGRFMRTGKDRVQVETVNGTVAIGTVRVAARDIVVADANGVVIVPRHRARDVAQTARAIESVESLIRDQITQGSTLREARAALGYHHLQTKK